MATTTVNKLNGLISQKSLTAEQAQQQYGLAPSATSWMKNIGVQFASSPSQTSTAVSGDIKVPTVQKAANVVAGQGTAPTMQATQASPAGNVNPGTATAGNVVAPTAASAPGVQAGTGTAQQINASQATAAPGVQAPNTTTSLIDSAPVAQSAGNVSAGTGTA